MIVTGWILVGIIGWADPQAQRAPAPNYGVHSSLSSCEALRTQIESAARRSSLYCVEVSVHMPK
jgi:hypothetical protein